jgi:hypothetical protein
VWVAGSGQRHLTAGCILDPPVRDSADDLARGDRFRVALYSVGATNTVGNFKIDLAYRSST